MISLKKSRYRGRVIVGPTHHLLRANRTNSNGGPAEKRRFRGFQAPQNAFTLLRGPDGKLGQIIDISKGGLAFRYVGNGRKPKKAFQLDIFLANNGFRLEKVSFETVEKPASERLVENVQMQGLRNRGPARRVGSPSQARTNPEE